MGNVDSSIGSNYTGDRITGEYSFSNEKDIVKLQPNIQYVEDKRYIDGILHLDESQVEITTKKLGSGRTGTVEEGIMQCIPVAVKKFMDMGNIVLDDAKNEMRIMQSMNNEHVIKFFGGIITNGKIQIIMEKLDGTLFDLLTKNKMTLYRRMSYVQQVSEGLKYLHQNRVLHGDYKSENVLYCRNTDTLKISDFGFSKVISSDQDCVPHNKGSVFYLAPEVYKKKMAGFYSDIFSFGITLAVHITQRHPYEDQFISEYDFLDLVCEPTCLRPSLPYRTQECPASLKALCESCWHPDPKERPSFDLILLQLDKVLHDCSLLDDFKNENAIGNPSKL